MENLELKRFWAGKRVLVTGHTGFKGAWLSEILISCGAIVFGVSLVPENDKSLHSALRHDARLNHHVIDICDEKSISEFIKSVKPDIVFHFAAVSLVKPAYSEPAKTWRTNVLGTINILEALRGLENKIAVIVATTDKVYHQRKYEEKFKEDSILWGKDPYSSSKVGTELVIDCWRTSFLADTEIRLAAVRAGNVIGGGDWSQDRIMPDIVRSLETKNILRVRNGNSIRPWQHVLEPIHGYLLLAEKLSSENYPEYAHAFNFGPDQDERHSVVDLVKEAFKYWEGMYSGVSEDFDAPPEADFLLIDSARAQGLLNWKPKWSFERTIYETIHWYKQAFEGVSPIEITRAQIEKYWSEL